MTRCQWWPGYASCTAVVGMPALQFPSRRAWISSGGVLLLREEDSAEGVDGVGALRAGAREPLAGRGVGDLLRDELACVLRGCASLADRAIDVDLGNDREVEVVHPLADRSRHLRQP